MVEKSLLRLGYMPLTDSLPLVVASEWGLFADEGLSVTLQRETSWATLRDRVMVGQLDAAQMLAPMVLAGSLGLGGLRVPLETAYALGRNGNAITVSHPLFAQLLDLAREDTPLGCARALARVVAARRERGLARLVFAVVYPFSAHAYLLRHWLAAAAIDPDRDIDLVVLPPSQMADHLRLGHIDGFCAGEPWNSWAVQRQVGHVLISGHQIWQNAPEKVLGVTAQWALQHPDTHAALVRALYRAGELITQDLNAALVLLSRGDHVSVPVECLTMASSGRLPAGLGQLPLAAEHFHVFSGKQANFPWQSQALWFIAQMQRWGQLPSGDYAQLVQHSWRSDCYRQFLAGICDAPINDHKVEGAHLSVWQTPGEHGPLMVAEDAFVDAALFDSVSILR